MNHPKWRYFLYTNLPNMTVPGWTTRFKIPEKGREGPYNRFITQSRWGKFMAWQDPAIQHCQIVIYHDASTEVRLVRIAEMQQDLHATKYQTASRMGQSLHPKGGGVREEFDRILGFQKDIQSNVDKSLTWLESQNDFSPNASIYLNRIIGACCICVRAPPSEEGQSCFL